MNSSKSRPFIALLIMVLVVMQAGREVDGQDVSVRLIVTGEQVNVRQEPLTGSKVLKTVKAGEELIQLDQKGNWHKVKLEDGAIGWIYHTFVAKKPEAETSRKEPSPPVQPSAPTLGSIVVKSQPLGATVYLNGKKEGITPLTILGVTTGSHRIRLELKGHTPKDVEVMVMPGQQAIVSERLKELPKSVAPSEMISVPQSDSRYAVTLFFLFLTIVILWYVRSVKKRGLEGKPVGLFRWGTAGRITKSTKLIAKARRRAESNSQDAIALYTRAIDLLSSTQGMDGERQALLGPALLGRGKLQEDIGDVSNAFDSYLQARAILPSIPQPVLSFITLTLARRGDTKTEAIAIYLEFIRSLKDQEKPSTAQVVYALLEKCCAVAENSGSKESQERLALCRQVIETDPNLEWSHYYAGMAHFSRRQYATTVSYFQRAKALQSRKPMLGFYLAFSTGLQHAQTGKLELAVDALRQASQAAPKRADTHFALGKALVELCYATGTKNPERPRWVAEAVASLEQAVQLDSKQADYAYYLGQAQLLAGNISQAVKSFEQATRLDKNKADYFLHLGLSLKRIGSVDRAKEAARSAIALDKQYMAAHRLLGELCLETKEFQQAAAEFEIVLSSHPNDIEARANLGFALYSKNHFRLAIQTLEPIHSQSDTAAFYLARCYAQVDEFEKAVEQLETLTTRQLSDSQILYYLALGYAHLGHFTDAVETFGKAISTDGAQASYYFQRGHAYVKLGHLAEARTDYEKALELRPGDGEILFQLGCLCRATGEDELAATYLSQVVSLALKHVSARVALGAVHEEHDRIHEALAEYSAAAQLDPKNPAIHRRLGVLRCKQGDYAAASKDLQQAAALGDDSDEMLHYLGLAATNDSDFAGALKTWSKLHGRHPEDQRLALNLNRLHYLLGKQHIEAGRLAEAIAEWGAYLEPRPDDEELKEEIAKLHFQVALDEFAGNGTSASNSAKAALEQAIALDPENPIYHYHLALCDLAAGQWDAYIANIQNLMQQLDAKMQLHAKYHLGIAWIAKNEPEKAEPLLTEVQSGAGQTDLDLDVSLPLAVVNAKAGRWTEAVNALNSTMGKPV